jgi:hypothetical protein
VETTKAEERNARLSSPVRRPSTCVHACACVGKWQKRQVGLPARRLGGEQSTKGSALAPPMYV